MKSVLFFFSFLAISFAIQAQPGSGNMLDFNGTSTYVETGAINLNGTQITMETWVRVDNFKSTFPYISSLIGTEENSSNSSALLRIGDASIPNDVPQFVLRINGSPSKVESTMDLATGRWYHIAGTYDGSTMKIYINGTLQGSLSVSGTIESNDVFALGRNYGNDRVLDGKLDESRVWNTALSESTIREWMCKKVTGAHPNYSSLLGYWRYDEGAGTTVSDQSGNNNDGTFNGTPTWQTSSAPVGDASVYDYSSPFLVNLPFSGGGFMTAASSSNNVDGLHLYRVDALPNTQNLPPNVDTAQQDHYWGVFAAGSGTMSFTASYFFNGNPLFPASQDCKIAMIQRSNNADTLWVSNPPDSLDFTNDFISLNGTNQREFWLARSGVLALGIDGSTTICNGDTANLFIPQASSYSASSFSWEKDLISINGANSSMLAATDSGDYTASLTTSAGCTVDFGPITIITEPGEVTLTSIQDLCENEPSFQLTGGFPSSGNYKVNGQSSAFFFPSVYGPGVHTVTYIAFNQSLTCYDSAEVTVEVFEVPDVMLDLDTTICEGQSIILDQGSPLGGTYSGNGVNAGTFESSSTGPGSFTLSYAVTSNEGCSDTAEGTVNVNIQPLAPTISLLGQALKSSLATGIQWYRNGNPISGATTQLFTPTQDGNYQVTFTGPDGCESELSEPYVILFTGLKELTENGFTIWPNPAQNQVSILAEKQMERVVIFDMSGRIVIDQEINDRKVSINLESVESGMYRVQITGASDQKSSMLLKR